MHRACEFDHTELSQALRHPILLCGDAKPALFGLRRITRAGGHGLGEIEPDVVGSFTARHGAEGQAQRRQQNRTPARAAGVDGVRHRLLVGRQQAQQANAPGILRPTCKIP